MAQTLQVQDMSGQIIMPLIRKYIHKALKIGMNSSDISPYTIITHPKVINQPGYLKAFNNCPHIDSTDITNEEQGEILSDFILSHRNDCLTNYFARMRRNFADTLDNNCLPLFTSCAWKPIKQPENYSFKHISFFVMTEVAVSWDLSLDVFASGINILGGTFLGSLIEHGTSCSLYVNEISDWEVQEVLKYN